MAMLAFIYSTRIIGVMPTQVTPEDLHVLGSFRGQWRSAGWGVEADGFNDVEYGTHGKFFAALFLPEAYVAMLEAQHQEMLDALRTYNFSPFDPPSSRRPPAKPTALDYSTLFESPNFVSGLTAADVCMDAIRKANELYPGQVPTCTTELGRLAAINFGHSVERS